MSETSKPWLEVSSAIDHVRSSLSQLLKEQYSFENSTTTLGKATADFKEKAKALGVSLAIDGKVSKDAAREFYKLAFAVRAATKEARDMEIRYKGMQMAAMSFGDIVVASADKITGLANNIKKLAGIGIAGGVGLKSLTEANLAFKRSLFESDKIASRYGDTLGGLKSALQDIRVNTEMSQQDFSNLNNQIKQLYLGIPPTAQAIAGMVKELRGRVGFSDDVISKTLEGLVNLQSKVPQIMESVQAAWAAASAGQGDSANKMALQTRLLLTQTGATRAEIEKVMAAMEPRSAGTRSPFLDFEQGMAKAEQRAKDAQVALSLKLQPVLTGINYALTKLADILSGEVNSGLANAVAGFAALALPVAGAIKGGMALANVYKEVAVAMSIRQAGGLAGWFSGAAAGAGSGGGPAGPAAGMAGGRILGMGVGGLALAGGVGAAGYSGWKEYQRRREMGESGVSAAANGGMRGGLSLAGGLIAGAGVGLLTKNATAAKLAFAAGSVGTSMYLGRNDGKGPKTPEGEGSLSMEDSSTAYNFKNVRKEETQKLAAEAGLFSRAYEGGAQEVQKLLQTEDGILKVRAESISKFAAEESLAKRIVIANEKLKQGLIARSEYLTIVGGKEKDSVSAANALEKALKEVVSVDRSRYEASTQIMEAMQKQLALLDKLSDAGNNVVDGLSKSLANLQGEGLFRDGFGTAFDNAIKMQESNVEISAKKMQAVLIRNLAGQGELKDLNPFINLDDANIRTQVEAARKGLKDSVSNEESIKLKISDKQAELPVLKGDDTAIAAVNNEIAGLEAELTAARGASEKFNETIIGFAKGIPTVKNLDNTLSEMQDTLSNMISSGDFSNEELQGYAEGIKEITKAKEELILAEVKLGETKVRKSEASEKAMLVNNEKAIQLSKQRIALAEDMNMGMARTWKYTKETVALQERQLQLLTQQSERLGQDMQEAVAGTGIKLDIDFAKADYEGFLADVDAKLKAIGLKENERVTITNKITQAANKQLDVEGKILQTSSDIMKTTKQMREGWLEAVEGSLFGFGDMEKLIGTQDRSATQLLQLGAPATYKYGGLMDQRPAPGSKPVRFADVYASYRNGDPNSNPFPETDLERSTGVRNFPYQSYGYDDINDLKRQALVQGESQRGSRLMMQGTEQQDFGLQGIQAASIQTATSLNGVAGDANLLRDAFRELVGVMGSAEVGSAARNPGGATSITWMQGVPQSNNWGPSGRGTAAGTSEGRPYVAMSTGDYGMAYRRGGGVKKFGYGGSLEAGSYIVSEGATRANADSLSQIPGVTYAARGGGLDGQTRAGHDSIYYDIPGYGGGGAVLMPNEAIIPPEYASLGPSLNHYAGGGLVAGLRNLISPGAKAATEAATRYAGLGEVQIARILSANRIIQQLAVRTGQNPHGLLKLLEQGGGKVSSKAGQLGRLLPNMGKASKLASAGKLLKIGGVAVGGAMAAWGGSKEFQKRAEAGEGAGGQWGGALGKGGYGALTTALFFMGPLGIAAGAGLLAYDFLGGGSDKLADFGAGLGRKITGEKDPVTESEKQRKQLAELNANYEVQMSNAAKWAQEQGFKDFPQAASMAQEGLIDLQPDPKNQDKWLMKYLSDKAQDEVTMRIGNDEAKASVQSKYSRQIQEQLAASQKRGALFSLIDSKGMEEKKSKLPLSLQSSLEQSMINQALVERAQTKQGKTTWSSPEDYDKMLEPYLRTAPESAKAHWEKYKDADVNIMDMNNPLRTLRQVDKKEASQARIYAQNFGNDPSRYTRDFMLSPEGKKIGEQYGGNIGLWLADEAAKINDSRGSKFGTSIRQSLLAVDPKYEEKVAKMTASKSLRGFTPEGVNYSVDSGGYARQLVNTARSKKENSRTREEKNLLLAYDADELDKSRKILENSKKFIDARALKETTNYQVGMTKKIMGDEAYSSAVENSRKEHPETWEKYGEKAEAIFARKQQMVIAEHARRMNPLDRTPEQSLAMGHLVGKYANGKGLPVKPRGFGRLETDNLYGGPQKDRTGPLMFSDIVDDANKGIYTEQAKDAIGPGAMGQLGLKEMSPEASFWQDRAAARIKESERLSAQAHAAYSYSSDGSKTYNPSPRNAVYDYYHSNGRDSKGPMKSGSTEYTSMSNEAGAAYMPGARVVLPGSNQLTPAEWKDKGVMVAPGASAKPMDAAAWELKYGAARGGYVGYAKGGKFGSRLNTSNFGSGDGGAGFRTRMNTSEFRSGDGGAGFRSRMNPSEFRSGAPSSFGNRGDGGAGFRSRMTPSSFARGGFVGGARRMSSQLNETARTNTANKVSSTAPQKNGYGGNAGPASPQLFKLEMDSDFKGLAVISNKSMNYGNPNQAF